MLRDTSVSDSDCAQAIASYIGNDLNVATAFDAPLLYCCVGRSNRTESIYALAKRGDVDPNASTCFGWSLLCDAYCNAHTVKVLFDAFGDRIDVDIKPAKLAGMRTCLLWKKSDEADYSFDNFEDILGIF